MAPLFDYLRCHATDRGDPLVLVAVALDILQLAALVPLLIAFAAYLLLRKGDRAHRLPR